MEREAVLNKQFKEAEIKAEEIEKIKREKKEMTLKRIDESRKINREI